MREPRPRCRIHRALGIAQAAAFAAAVPAALAQAPDDEPARNTLRVEVTGSHIARIEGESGLPVQTITRQEILDAGVQTMQDLLERISANQSFGSWNEAKGIGNLLTGFTAASLRGLGSQRTLILLNGRRLAPYALSGGQSVDLSGIPPSAIERVEVLKDGASAVYGTDALGGVINFVLRNDYSGAEANGNAYVTEHGGGDNWRVSAAAGWGDLAKDRYNLFVVADYFQQDALRASQREASRTAYLPALGLDLTSGYTFPANIAQTDLATGESWGFPGFRNPTIPYPGGPAPDSCLPPTSFPTEGGRRYQCYFDYASLTDTIPEASKANARARFTWRFDGGGQFFAEASYYEGRFTQRISPTPVRSGSSTSTSLPATSSWYPSAFVAGLPDGDPNAPVELFYRTVELGARVDRTTTEQWNAVAGVQGTFAGWDVEVAGTWTRNRQVGEFQSGYLHAGAFLPLMASGAVNPFGPNPEAVLRQMRATQITGPMNDNRASNYGIDAKLTRDLARAPGGPVTVAFGAEARRESLEQSNAEVLVSDDVVGGGGQVPSITSVDRTVGTLFGEVNVPVTTTLEANAAVRYDHYSDFGGTTNPKLTLRWQPRRSALLRASWGKGFRAPTLSDLFLPQVREFAFDEAQQDPIRCPVTGTPADCESMFVPVLIGGNPALEPETSEQVNAGIVLEPASGVSIGLDYYRVEVRNVIGVLPVDTIFQNYAQLGPGYVVRKPPTEDHPHLPGPIDYVVQYPTNTGDLTTSGLDVNLMWRGPATPAGTFSFTLNGTYVIDYRYQGFESVALPSGVGTRGPDGAIARYRQYAQLGWTRGPWGATLANTTQSGYSEVDLLTCGDEGCTGTRRVGTWSVWDLQLRYGPSSNLNLTLGVRNLFDRAPPVSNQSNTFQVGYDPSYADPRGRIFYGALRYALP
ncbi:MAG TPA: TonB-dependent receptor [Casimicrobiaceae bacterium]|nr:TonB-dependent receptor [Casimicrobiaceae bacterium]